MHISAGLWGNCDPVASALGNMGQSTTKLSEEHLLTSLLQPSHQI